ncbi:MAG: hypothetical protein ABH882_04125 [Candidatus Omnitrophota bacterium]|nr:hypothetical protein [Candidatus Omnitrophota bacterium]MBU1929532.1 hypothetical protein [Candidatus Omnitrophota bacterium]MBU2035819.1 hypothetical protein [Candidatus Omnitrophota bacterium]MBU2221387.1 hypothetical protein [Candidatus Omnitrophota bacterium]MBU2258715.1 hypothetical protein [Candidatus Omnitrophota bacterium]
MKFSRFIFLVVFITFFSVMYVWQQAEVFKLAYIGQKKLVVFQELLDKNSILRYNLKKNTSLIRIGDKVSQSDDFQMPDNYLLVRLDPAAQAAGYASDKAPVQKESLLSRIFSIKRQVEAKTISP